MKINNLLKEKVNKVHQHVQNLVILFKEQGIKKIEVKYNFEKQDYIFLLYK